MKYAYTRRETIGKRELLGGQWTRITKTVIINSFDCLLLPRNGIFLLMYAWQWHVYNVQCTRWTCHCTINSIMNFKLPKIWLDIIIHRTSFGLVLFDSISECFLFWWMCFLFLLILLLLSNFIKCVFVCSCVCAWNLNFVRYAWPA